VAVAVAVAAVGVMGERWFCSARSGLSCSRVQVCSLAK